MTAQELCRSTGLTLGKLEQLLDCGLLETTKPAAGPGHPREFDASQVERARVFCELRRKGVTVAQLAGGSLALDGAKYVVYDGDRLRACRDAEAAIAAVVRARGWCSAVDLSAIRAG